MLAERSELEIKKLRSSQILNKVRPVSRSLVINKLPLCSQLSPICIVFIWHATNYQFVYVSFDVGGWIY